MNRREHPSPIEPASGIARVELLDNLGNAVAAADFGSDAEALHWRPTPIITGLDINSALERAARQRRLEIFDRLGYDVEPSAFLGAVADREEINIRPERSILAKTS